MASVREKVAAEQEQMEQALHELPDARRINNLSVLELAGTASLLSSLYHGVENIIKQGLLAGGAPLPTGASWHRDLLQAACAQGILSSDIRDRLVPYMAFRHFFTHSYGFDLDAERLLPLVREIQPVYTAFIQDVDRFLRTQAKKQRSSKRTRQTGSGR